MTMTNFEMEPTPAPQPEVKVFMPRWAKIVLGVLALLSLYCLYRAQTSLEAQDEMQSTIKSLKRSVMGLESDSKTLKKQMTWSKEKQKLLKRAIKAERGEQALREELGRVYANLQGKNYTPPPKNFTIPDDPDEPVEEEEADEDRPDAPAPFDYNSCNREEHLTLCGLIKDDPESVETKSRSCARKSLGWGGPKKHKFAECFMEEIPQLSEHCAMCFADAASWGYKNCKLSCASSGDRCEKCLQPYAEDHRKCMGFLLPGYGMPADCPVQVEG